MVSLGHVGALLRRVSGVAQGSTVSPVPVNLPSLVDVYDLVILRDAPSDHYQLITLSWTTLS